MENTSRKTLSTEASKSIFTFRKTPENQDLVFSIFAQWPRYGHFVNF